MAEAPFEVDPDTLLPVVREATSRPGLELSAWSAEPIQGGSGRAAGIWRVTGQAIDRAEQVKWSVVVKVLEREDGAESPGSWNYWRREADAYASGFLDHLPGPLRAPRCFGVQELRSEAVGIWLEDMDEAGDEWSSADLAAVATDLGELSGGYLHRSVPEHTWLSRDWLRGYVEYNAPSIDLLRRSADDPWVRLMFPPDDIRWTLNLWDDREWVLEVLARLPQSVCHMDAFSRNLFRCRDVAGERYAVAIDWAFVGTGAVGEELAPLVVASLTLGGVEADITELEGSVISGYIEGLSRSGFRCDPRLVRLAYAASGCLRYSIGPLEVILPVLLDQQRHAWFEQLLGMPMHDICDQFATFRNTVLWPLLHEARAMEHELGIL